MNDDVIYCIGSLTNSTNLFFDCFTYNVPKIIRFSAWIPCLSQLLGRCNGYYTVGPFFDTYSIETVQIPLLTCILFKPFSISHRTVSFTRNGGLHAAWQLCKYPACKLIITPPVFDYICIVYKFNQRIPTVYMLSMHIEYCTNIYTVLHCVV